MSASKLEWKPLTLTPVNFSLTEGTSIPAPPDSPPATPRPPTDGQGPLSSHPTPKSPGFPQKKGAASADSAAAQTSQTSDAAGPLSPTSPTLKRPGSVRKFLGLRSMSSDSLNSERPSSPAPLNGQPNLSRSKSGSWFGGRKKTFSMGVGTVPEVRENSQTPKQAKGPPPPALPELKTLGVNDDTLNLGADDMFKNI